MEDQLSRSPSSRMLALTLLVCLSGALSQPTYPFIQLKANLRNNSIIDLSLFNTTDQLRCVTDINSCCSSQQGPAERAWVLPNGTRLTRDGEREISSFTVHAAESSLALQLSDPVARGNPALSGVYECSIDTSSGLQSVFVGLYYEPDAERIQVEGISFSGASGPPSTITCTTTGRPATLVEWYRRSERIIDADSTTVLDDPTRARYTHSLHLSKREGGIYKCFLSTINEQDIANLVTTSAELNIKVGSEPKGVLAVQQEPTSANVQWTVPSPLSDTVGYQVYYTGPTSGSVTVDRSEGETASMVVTGLTNGGAYHFSVAGRSEHFESNRVADGNGPVLLFPGAPELTIISTTTDSVTVFWSVPSGTVVVTFDLQWSVEGEQEPRTLMSGSLPGSADRHSTSGLGRFENVTVQMMVTSVNEAGRNTSAPLTLHSNILQNFDMRPEDGSGSTTLNVGALIGGAVGIFLVSIAAGILISFIAHKYYKKTKSKQTAVSMGEYQEPLSPPLPVRPPADPATRPNAAYTISEPVTALNTAYQSDTTSQVVVYDYI